MGCSPYSAGLDPPVSPPSERNGGRDFLVLRRSGEELVHRPEIAGVLPDLDDAAFSDMEHDRLAILEGGAARSLTPSGLQHDGVVIACQHVVDLATERPAGELTEPAHRREQLMLAAADAGVHAASRRVPHDIVGHQRIDGAHVVRVERLEQFADDLLVRMQAIPPWSAPERIDHPQIADSPVLGAFAVRIPVMARRAAEVFERTEAELVARARLGDRDAFERLTAGYWRELHLHCYRMLGSLHDAEDLVQETLLRAWRAVGGFESRSSVRTWLYRIATNACLNALAERPRRALPSGLVPSSNPLDPSREPILEPVWLEPYPDRLLEDLGDPAARYARREAIELAFLAAIQLLPPRQRAVLLLRDVLEWSAAEVADVLDVSASSVHSAVRRARATLAKRAPGDSNVTAPTVSERALLERYIRAFERADSQGLARLLAEDVEMTMPPDPTWFRGRAHVLAFLRSRVFAVRGAIAVEPTAANRHPAVALYERGADSERGLSIQVLTYSDRLVASITGFIGDELFPAFGLPITRPNLKASRYSHRLERPS
jgi:RNA polymerase sigma-70 factor, ECF subfamily